tara:strand:- start:337 stop:606 length:270 start_codon:yes stop_codon:yes gene_type:complete
MKEDEYFERLEKFALSLGYKYDDDWGFPTYDMLMEIERLRKERDLLWDAISFAGTGGNQTEEIAFWHHNLLNMNEGELKEALKKHYEGD